MKCEVPSKEEKASGMPIITCECGKHIMVVPDVKKMSQAIKEHLKEHKLDEHKRIEDILIGKLLSAIA